MKNGNKTQSYELTSKQQKAFAQLKRAFKACEKANVYVWSNYGTISAVNGNIIKHIGPNDPLGESLNYTYVSSIFGYSLGDNADDALYVEYEVGHENDK